MHHCVSNSTYTLKVSRVTAQLYIYKRNWCIRDSWVQLIRKFVDQSKHLTMSSWHQLEKYLVLKASLHKRIRSTSLRWALNKAHSSSSPLTGVIIFFSWDVILKAKFILINECLMSEKSLVWQFENKTNKQQTKTFLVDTQKRKYTTINCSYIQKLYDINIYWFCSFYLPCIC